MKPKIGERVWVEMRGGPASGVITSIDQERETVTVTLDVPVKDRAVVTLRKDELAVVEPPAEG